MISSLSLPGEGAHYPDCITQLSFQVVHHRWDWERLGYSKSWEMLEIYLKPIIDQINHSQNLAGILRILFSSSWKVDWRSICSKHLQVLQILQPWWDCSLSTSWWSHPVPCCLPGGGCDPFPAMHPLFSVGGRWIYRFHQWLLGTSSMPVRSSWQTQIWSHWVHFQNWWYQHVEISQGPAPPCISGNSSTHFSGAWWSV